MFPIDKFIEVPLLQVLIKFGGEGQIRDIHSLVAKRFPEITEKKLTETFFTGSNKWEELILWVIRTLVIKEEVFEPRLGVIEITDKGKKRAWRARHQ